MDEKLYAKDLAACPSYYCATRGDRAPLFSADAFVGDKIRKVSLDDFKGKWVLLFFYESDFTFV